MSLGIFIGKISKESAGKNQSHINGRITAVKVDIICMYNYNIGSTHMVLFNVKNLISTSKLPGLIVYFIERRSLPFSSNHDI